MYHVRIADYFLVVVGTRTWGSVRSVLALSPRHLPQTLETLVSSEAEVGHARLVRVAREVLHGVPTRVLLSVRRRVQEVARQPVVLAHLGPRDELVVKLARVRVGSRPRSH